MSNVFQSTYKQLHSTEIALLRVHNEILLNIDNGTITVLTLLDLSTSFDTITHSILVDRLSLWNGESGVNFSWHKSDLSGRHQL